MAIRIGDFIELKYTGKAEGAVFDTTDIEVAKKNGIYNKDAHYGSVRIRVGDGLLLKSLDEDVVGKEPNKDYNLKLAAEKAFGKKTPELIRMIPKRKFSESGINPVAGMPVNIDGVMAIIRTVSGGRILVDFNHPLAGKDVEYDYKITKIITDTKEKAESIIAMELGLKPEEYLLELKEDKKEDKTITTAVIDLKNKELDPVKEPLGKKIKELLGIEVEFK